MTITRYGAGETGAGGQKLPFARAVQANGWLHVSGQVAMENGEIVQGGIVAESRKAIDNMIAILKEAGYGLEDIVRIGVWLDDPRDFWSFNGVYA
jgi:enamine deaminase RidA (YjgF/YER057c/UK114 family)